MLALLALLNSFTPLATNSPASWSFAYSGMKDGLVVVELKAEVEDGWHLYAMDLPSDEGPIATSVRLKPSADFQVIGAVKEPTPEEVYDGSFGMIVRYHSGDPTFTVSVRPIGSGPFEVEGEVEYMVCNDKTCLPPVVVPFRITVPAS